MVEEKEKNREVNKNKIPQILNRIFKENPEAVEDLIDGIFKENPEAVEEAKNMKLAEYYLAGLIIDELVKPNKTVNDTVFNIVRKKLEAHIKLRNGSKN